MCDIPIFHDDQHGTAIISGAALVNALELVNKKIDEVRVVFAGAGAAGIACADLYLNLGVKRENIHFVDTVGVIYKGRTEKMNPYKERFAVETKERTLADAMKGADVFVGVSAKDLVTPEMLKSMAANPIVFAMANPDPEIPYPLAVATRKDVIMATGRSDYPNQVNNVLGFPFIFRGALDVRAKAINNEMKMAASHALAKLAKEDVPEVVLKAYGVNSMSFGREYLIPKPFDPRVLTWEAPAVAKAACDTGVARKPITDWDGYREQLERMLGPSRKVMHFVMRKARTREAEAHRVPRGRARLHHPRRPRHRRPEDRDAGAARERGGDPRDGRARSASSSSSSRSSTCRTPKKGTGLREGALRSAAAQGRHHSGGGGHGEGPDGLRADDGADRRRRRVRGRDVPRLPGDHPAGHPDPRPEARRVARVGGPHPRAEGPDLLLRRHDGEHRADAPRNWRRSRCWPRTWRPTSAPSRRSPCWRSRASGRCRTRFRRRWRTPSRSCATKNPKIVIDGEMHLDTAVVEEIVTKNYPHSRIKGDANVLIFPDLTSGNIGYKLVQRLGGADALGPILLGVRKPVNVLQHGMTVAEIVNVAAITAMSAE